MLPAVSNYSPWKIYLNLYVRNISANLLGFSIILVLNLFTPLSFFRLRKLDFLSDGGWQYFLLVFPLILLLVALLQYVSQCPICAFLTSRRSGIECARYSRIHIQQRALNLPLILSLTNLSLYILVSLTLIASLYLLDVFPVDFRIAMLLFFRALMVGLITSTLSFFIVESYTRRVLIPMVFPDGHLSSVPGAFRVDVGRRIKLLNLAGTLTPMIILVVTLGFVVWEVHLSPGLPNLLLMEIFWFTLVLCSIFVFIGFRLNSLVGHSVVDPIAGMVDVVEEVEKGDFNQRIQVVSNDEIGLLGEAGNEMIQGLAERERVRESFGRYVTPEIRDKILSGRIPLDGEKKEATILFSDLRGFTRYVETNPPEEVILSMREYFTVMERAIRAHEGIILQYVGDELEAVFGAPVEIADHPDKAVHSALDMRQGLKELNEKRRLEDKMVFKHGVGVCSGLVLAGNTGSQNRPAYTLIGDTVNKASRIQELTKDLGCDILIAKETRDRLSSLYPLRKHEEQSVKGHISPVMVYEVLDQD